MKIIVIDDLQTNLDFFQEALKANFEVATFLKASDAFASMLKNQPDLVLVDCLMPEMDGHQVLVKIKNAFPHMPVIMISGYRAEENLLKALDMMVDDFVFKPVAAEELIARITNKILRARKIALTSKTNEVEDDENIKFNDLYETVTFVDQELKLQSKEYRLFKFLVKRKNQLVTREEIFVNIWEDIYVSPATLDTHMCQLRKKLENHGEKIVTRKNTGFIYSTENIQTI